MRSTQTIEAKPLTGPQNDIFKELKLSLILKKPAVTQNLIRAYVCRMRTFEVSKTSCSLNKNSRDTTKTYII